MGPYETHQYSNYRDPTRRREKERVQEKFWRDYSWKFPHGKGNSQSNPRGAKSSIQNIPKEKYVRHTLIKLTKTKHKKKNIKKSKGEATSNIQGKHHTLNSWSFCRNFAGQKGIEGYI